MLTVSKLGYWNNIDHEILVSFAKFEQFCPYVFHVLTYKKINFFILWQWPQDRSRNIFISFLSFLTSKRVLIFFQKLRSTICYKTDWDFSKNDFEWTQNLNKHRLRSMVVNYQICSSGFTSSVAYVEEKYLWFLSQITLTSYCNSTCFKFMSSSFFAV